MSPRTEGHSFSLLPSCWRDNDVKAVVNSYPQEACTSGTGANHQRSHHILGQPWTWETPMDERGRRIIAADLAAALRSKVARMEASGPTVVDYPAKSNGWQGCSASL